MLALVLSCTVGETQCGDGIDNDLDDLMDCEDEDCAQVCGIESGCAVDGGEVECIEESSCCKVCDGASGSKACGDSCISGDNECHQDGGCACDSSDVCAG
jgi:hypothetical protein